MIFWFLVKEKDLKRLPFSKISKYGSSNFIKTSLILVKTVMFNSLGSNRTTGMSFRDSPGSNLLFLGICSHFFATSWPSATSSQSIIQAVRLDGMCLWKTTTQTRKNTTWKLIWAVLPRSFQVVSKCSSSVFQSRLECKYFAPRAMYFADDSPMCYTVFKWSMVHCYQSSEYSWTDLDGWDFTPYPTTYWSENRVPQNPPVTICISVYDQLSSSSLSKLPCILICPFFAHQFGVNSNLFRYQTQIFRPTPDCMRWRATWHRGSDMARLPPRPRP